MKSVPNAGTGFFFVPTLPCLHPRRTIMSNSQTVEFGLLCLQALDQTPAMTLEDICRDIGVSALNCRQVLDAFESAGIVSQDDNGRYQLEQEIENLTAVEVLEALWYAPVKLPAFR